jgi:hypothetical protein
MLSLLPVPPLLPCIIEATRMAPGSDAAWKHFGALGADNFDRLWCAVPPLYLILPLFSFAPSTPDSGLLACLEPPGRSRMS